MSATVQVVILGDASGAQAAFAKTAASAEAFGNQMKKMGAPLEALGKTMTHAITMPVVRRHVRRYAWNSASSRMLL